MRTDQATVAVSRSEALNDTVAAVSQVMSMSGPPMATNATMATTVQPGTIARSLRLPRRIAAMATATPIHDRCPPIRSISSRSLATASQGGPIRSLTSDAAAEPWPHGERPIARTRGTHGWRGQQTVTGCVC